MGTTTTVDLTSSIQALFDAIMQQLSANLPVVLGGLGVLLAIFIVVGLVLRVPKKVTKV